MKPIFLKSLTKSYFLTGFTRLNLNISLSLPSLVLAIVFLALYPLKLPMGNDLRLTIWGSRGAGTPAAMTFFLNSATCLM